MKVGVLGTGSVGQTIGTKLVELGHEVRMGSRAAGGDKATMWSESQGVSASEGTFADAADFGELVFNCTAGAGAVAAATSAADALGGKVLIDLSNPLELSGPSPSLFVAVTDSLGEQVQRAVPSAQVVKALNTMNAAVMVEPELVPGDHVVFVCGDDDAAKTRTTELLGSFGWPAERVVDCGDITGARATESFLLLWLKLSGWAPRTHLNIAVPRALQAG